MLLSRLLRRMKRWHHKWKFLSRQSNTYGLPLRKKLAANFHGFTADEYTIYQLNQHDWRNYIPEFDRLAFRERVMEYRVLLDNKIVFYQLAKTFAPLNTMYAYRKNGMYCCLESGWEQNNVLHQLRQCGALARKKLTSGGGDGFLLAEYRDGNYYLNREPCSEAALAELLYQDDYILEEFCRQSDFENHIWPYAVNTIRLVTVSQKNQTVQSVIALHRFGMNPNRCVDNIHAGGLYAEIDVHSGRLSGAVCRDRERFLDKKGNLNLYSAHPLSNVPIQGETVPHWQKIKAAVEQLHAKLTFTGIPFIAWDIALTEDGYRIIEANTSSAMPLLQTFRGMKHTVIGEIICPSAKR